MNDQTKININTKRKQYSDLLELGKVFAFLFLIISICFAVKVILFIIDSLLIYNLLSVLTKIL